MKLKTSPKIMEKPSFPLSRKIKDYSEPFVKKPQLPIKGSHNKCQS